MPLVAVVHAIARDGGSRVRVGWWRDVLALEGIDTVEVPLIASDRRVLPRGAGQLGDVLAGAAPPETLAWSPSAARRALAAVRPDAVVVVTLRAYSPAALGTLDGQIPVLVDAVDRLSASYRQRALIETRRPIRLAWRALARSMSRSEANMANRAQTVVAAGRSDAAALGAVWLPITVPLGAVDADRPVLDSSEFRWDALFVGTLDYPPNVAAVRELATTIWPGVLGRRPGSRLCVAGRRPTPEVRRLVTSMGAELVPDFDDYPTLASQAAVAVSPLPVATGVQIKVLDAAAAGVPQVVSPAAASGFAPGLAVRTATVDEAFAEALVALLDDPVEAGQLARRASAQVRSEYSTEHWSARVASLVTERTAAHGPDGPR